MSPQEILYLVKKVCIEIHQEYGPGLLEKAYQKILKIKLQKMGFKVEDEVSIDLVVEDEIIENAYFLDLLVNDCVIIELKAVQKIKPEHHKQLATYMKLTEKPYGLLVNFCCANLFNDGLRSWSLEQIKKFNFN